MTSTYWGVQLVELGAVAGTRLSFHPSPETIVRPGAREIVRSRSGGGRPQSYPMVRLFGPFHIFVASATVFPPEISKASRTCPPKRYWTSSLTRPTGRTPMAYSSPARA